MDKKYIELTDEEAISVIGALSLLSKTSPKDKELKELADKISKQYLNILINLKEI